MSGMRILAPAGKPPDQVRAIIGTTQAGEGHGRVRYHGLRVCQKLVESCLTPDEFELGERLRVLVTCVFSRCTPHDVVQRRPDRGTVLFRQ